MGTGFAMGHLVDGGAEVDMVQWVRRLYIAEKQSMETYAARHPHLGYGTKPALGFR
jgi:hypothetical protein